MPSARKKTALPKREYKSQRLELCLAPSAKKLIQQAMSVTGLAAGDLAYEGAAATKAAMRSTPAETGGSHSGGRKAMPSTSIWKTITEDWSDDQEAPEARLAAHASWRTFARRDFAGARSAED